VNGSSWCGRVWYPTNGFVVRSDQAWNAQNPAFYLRHCALGWCKIRIQACGNAEGVMLIGCAIFYGEITTPKRRIGFGDSRMPCRNVPTVKRPEVNGLAKLVTNVA